MCGVSGGRLSGTPSRQPASASSSGVRWSWTSCLVKSLDDCSPARTSSIICKALSKMKILDSCSKNTERIKIATAGYWTKHEALLGMVSLWPTGYSHEAHLGPPEDWWQPAERSYEKLPSWDQSTHGTMINCFNSLSLEVVCYAAIESWEHSHKTTAGSHNQKC